MKKIKKYIILFICFAGWIGLFIYFYNKENIKLQKKIPQYVLIDQLHYWKYVDSEWINIDSINSFDVVEDEINWNKYDIYIDNLYYDTLDYVFMDFQEYYFDDAIKSYEINDSKLLLNQNSYLKLNSFSLSDFSDEDANIVSNFMLKYNYSFNDITIMNKYVVDEESVIYMLSNYREYSNSDVFYLGFYRKNNKNYLLMNINNAENILYYKLFSVIDVKNKYNNFIFAYGCQDSVCYDMYEYNKGKYIKVIGD